MFAAAAAAIGAEAAEPAMDAAEAAAADLGLARMAAVAVGLALEIVVPGTGGVARIAEAPVPEHAAPMVLAAAPLADMREATALPGRAEAAAVPSAAAAKRAALPAAALVAAASG